MLLYGEMRLKLVLNTWRLSTASAVAWLAALTFNSWALAFIFNRRLFLHGGSVSELSVHGQPAALMFEVLGIVSGILIGLYAVLASAYTIGESKSRQILIYGTLIFG